MRDHRHRHENSRHFVRTGRDKIGGKFTRAARFNDRTNQWRWSREEMERWRNRLFTVFVGNLLDVYLPKTKNRGIAKSAFVRYRNEWELWRAINVGKRVTIKGRSLVVKVADIARNRVEGIKEKVGPRSYRDVLRARVNDNYSVEQRPNREEDKADVTTEFVVACKESKKVSERLKELAWKMREQKDGNQAASFKSWTECSVQIAEAENDWLKSSAVGRPRAGFSPEEIQREIFDTWFEDIRPYHEWMEERRVLVWVRLEDILLHLWQKSFFQAIVKITSKLKITLLNRVSVEGVNYWIRAFTIGIAGFINADSANNKSTMEKRKNGIAEHMVLSPAEEEEAYSDSSKEHGGVEKFLNLEKKRENKEVLKENKGVGLSTGSGPRKINKLNAEDKRKMIKEVRAKQGLGEMKPNSCEVEGSKMNTMLKARTNTVVGSEARRLNSDNRFTVLRGGEVKHKDEDGRNGKEGGATVKDSVLKSVEKQSSGKKRPVQEKRVKFDDATEEVVQPRELILKKDKGLRKDEKKRALWKLIKAEKPSMVFIQETKMESITGSLFDRLWRGDEVEGKVVEVEGRSSGILSLWQKKFFKLKECKTERNFIMLIGRVNGIDYRCGFINIYAFNDKGKRKELWDELNELMSNMEVWWIIRGDFNTVRFEDEQIGTGNVGRSSAQFDEFINYTGLVDLPLKGAKYTWCNNWQAVAFSKLDRVLIDRDSKEMIRIVTEEEVWQTVNNCDGRKAPGPDGYNMNFFKKQWRIVKGKVMEFVNHFFTMGKLEPGINNSFITLIPKVRNPVEMKDYRPINLVGIFYKIMAKILANKIKVVIDGMVGNNQFAFMEGRQLTNAVLVANELIDLIKKEKTNDTMIFYYLNLDQIRNIKKVLRIFQSMSGLKKNFAKNSLMGIDMELDIMEEWAKMIGCKNESLPSSYLRLPLGANHRSKQAAVKRELVKKGIINSADAFCPLCNDFIETVDHLFVGCKSVTSLWYDWCKEWGLAWTVWIGKNEVVFHNKVWDKELIWELIKLRVAMWVNVRWHDTTSSIIDIYRYPAVSQPDTLLELVTTAAMFR
ncbi:Uncharacterized protein TCM_022551 [Theobroma cacao]|uniref:Uncharacterized protein n=1 Tax=Theobroma cacao TaxID=3641 RepID=A0A061EUA1_THECC|nr:Uncharacterized protein TCM_022551 [Theobroma cacao]